MMEFDGNSFCTREDEELIQIAALDIRLFQVDTG